jgi:hypothetical protein
MDVSRAINHVDIVNYTLFFKTLIRRRLPTEFSIIKRRQSGDQQQTIQPIVSDDQQQSSSELQDIIHLQIT